MTAAFHLRRAGPAGHPGTARHRGHGGRSGLVAAVAMAGCCVAGMAALVHSYQIADTVLSDTAEFTWFWAGMLLVVLPIAALAGHRATRPAQRTALLILFGFLSYAPKLLRTPTAPLYHDELAHWRETHDVLQAHALFQQNPLIPIIARYPGLHAATAAVVHLAGLSIWQAALLLLICLHVLLVLGVAALAQALGYSSRTAALTAVLYGLNPSFLYFDTQYAYESMAITLVVWTLVSYTRVLRSPPGTGRAAGGVLTLILATATVVTHHLSTLALILIMAVIAVMTSLPWLARQPDWARTAVTAWTLTLTSAAAAAAWIAFAAPITVSYLSPYLGRGLSQLLRAAQGASSSRQLFGASLSPWWEQAAAFGTTVLALALAAGGIVLLCARIWGGSLPRGSRRALRCAFAAVGLVYFPSTLFILSPAGAEGARRSWTFTWIGLATLCAPAAVWLLDRAGQRMRRWRAVTVRVVLTAALGLALIGGTAAGMDASYRFPGPFLYGSDARSITPELLATGHWFLSRFGQGNRVVTDRYTALIFDSSGLQNVAAPSTGFPVYQLYLARPGAPIRPAYLLDELRGSHYTYLIVDRRMGYLVPQLGVYFSPDEPGTFIRPDGTPLFRGRLAKFATIPWLIRVFQSGNYLIYRFDFPPGRLLRVPVSLGRQPLRWHGSHRVRGRLAVTP